MISDKTEEVATDDFRAAASRWLRGLPTSGAAVLVEGFLTVFDRVFGEKALSLQCFVRSSVASLITVIVLFFIYFSSVPDPTGFLRDVGVINLWWVVVWAAVLNFVPDYLSLMETRFALGLATRSGSLAWISVADLVLTALIAFVALVAMVAYVVPVPGGSFWRRRDLSMPELSGDAGSRRRG